MRINLLHAHLPVVHAKFWLSPTPKLALVPYSLFKGISYASLVLFSHFFLFPFLSCACDYNLAQFYRVISNHYEKRILLNFPCLFNVVLPFCHNVILSFSYIYLCTLQAPSRNKQLTFNCSPLCCMDNVKLLILTLTCSAYNHILHIVT